MGVDVSAGRGVSIEAGVSEGRIVSVGRMGDVVGMEGEHEIIEKTLNAKSKARVVKGKGMEGILTDIGFHSFPVLNEKTSHQVPTLPAFLFSAANFACCASHLPITSTMYCFSSVVSALPLGI